MKNKILFLFLMLFSLSCSQPVTIEDDGSEPIVDKDVVHHPAPKTPKLIADHLLAKFKKSLALPPSAGSVSQAADEKALLSEQKTRTPQDCERAKTEVRVNLQNFYGTPNGTLNERQVTALSADFEQIRNDADYYIQALKKEFPRQRPFLYITGLEPCVAKEVTGAYPSGHATLANLYALILSDLIPAQKKEFAARANVIAQDRVTAGMHHPTDIAAGKKLGELVYKSLKSSKKYQDLFIAMQKKI